MTGTQVGLFNVSMLVNNEFGRSLQSSSMFYATPDEKLYNYQAYPSNLINNIQFLVINFDCVLYFLFKSDK